MVMMKEVGRLLTKGAPLSSSTDSRKRISSLPWKMISPSFLLHHQAHQQPPRVLSSIWQEKHRHATSDLTVGR